MVFGQYLFLFLLLKMDLNWIVRYIQFRLQSQSEIINCYHVNQVEIKACVCCRCAVHRFVAIRWENSIRFPFLNGSWRSGCNSTCYHVLPLLLLLQCEFLPPVSWLTYRLLRFHQAVSIAVRKSDHQRELKKKTGKPNRLIRFSLFVFSL